MRDHGNAIHPDPYPTFKTRETPNHVFYNAQHAKPSISKASNGLEVDKGTSTAAGIVTLNTYPSMLEEYWQYWSCLNPEPLMNPNPKPFTININPEP